MEKIEDNKTEEDYQQTINKLKQISIQIPKPSKLTKEAKKIEEKTLKQEITNLADNLLIFTSKTGQKHEYEYLATIVTQNSDEYNNMKKLAIKIYQYLTKQNKNTWLRYYYDTENNYFTVLLKQEEFQEIYKIIEDYTIIEE